MSASSCEVIHNTKPEQAAISKYLILFLTQLNATMSSSLAIRRCANATPRRCALTACERPRPKRITPRVLPESGAAPSLSKDRAELIATGLSEATVDAILTVRSKFATKDDVKKLKRDVVLLMLLSVLTRAPPTPDTPLGAMIAAFLGLWSQLSPSWPTF